MANVLEMVQELLTPALTKQYAEMIGGNETKVTEGMTLAAPLTLAAMAKYASHADNAQGLAQTLEKDLGSPLDAVTNGLSDVWLNQWFGAGIPNVSRWIENTTNIAVAPVLALAAPLVLHALRDAAHAQSLDAAGLNTLLQNEMDAYALAQPPFASEIAAALDAGENVNERAARIRAQFTAEEWDTLSKTPVLAGYAVMMSSLSGPVGINKEIRALLEAMDEFGHQAEPDSLVGLVSHEYNSPAHITSLGANRENAATLMRDACLETLRILNEKETYDEKVAYKEFVVNVATRVASAAIDGGIMSIGGTAISPEEQQTLDLIAAALAYP